MEGSLLDLTAVRPVGFFAWNAQSFLGRWARRTAMGVLAIARPFFYASNRVFATRVLHAVLRGAEPRPAGPARRGIFPIRPEAAAEAAGVAKLKEADGSRRATSSW